MKVKRDPVSVVFQSSDINYVNRLLKSSNPMDEFSTPESLSHHFVIVPSKLRLVTLVAFLLQKCKVCELCSQYNSTILK